MDDNRIAFSNDLEKIFYHNRNDIDWDKNLFLYPIYQDFQRPLVPKNLLNWWHILTLGIWKKFNVSLELSLFVNAMIILPITCIVEDFPIGTHTIPLSRKSQELLDFFSVLVDSLEYDTFLKDKKQAVLIYLINHDPYCDIIQNIFNLGIRNQDELKELFVLNFQTVVKEKSHEILYHINQHQYNEISQNNLLEHKLDTLFKLMLPSECEQSAFEQKNALLGYTNNLPKKDIQSLSNQLDDFIRQVCANPNGVSYQEIHKVFYQKTLTVNGYKNEQ